MINSFRHKGLRRLFEKGETKGVRHDHLQKVENILAVLNRARMPEELAIPGFRLHPLNGDRKSLWAVTVRANWRIVFHFENGNAEDVDLIDSH